MSGPTREAVLDALFQRLAAASFAEPVGGALGWVTAARRLKLWTEVPPAQQPALFQAEHGEDYQAAPSGLPKRLLTVELFLYARADGGQLGGVLLNRLIEAVEAALQPDDPSGTELTLDGLVSYCRIEGRVLKEPGDLDDQALAMVPLKILIP